MDIINQSFVDKKTGTVHTILNVVNGVALTDNIEKIPVTRLMDSSLYKQYQESVNESVNSNTPNPKPVSDVVDPNAFFNNVGTYNAFADKIRNIDTSKIKDDDHSIISSQPSIIPAQDLGVDNSVSAVYASTADDEMVEIAKKYGANLSNQQAAQQQNETFAKYMEESEDEAPVVRVNADTHQVQVETSVQPNYQTINQENPVHAVFRQAKRSLPFKAVVVQEGNLPRLDFIEMMEDSYETSIIDFLADDYVNQLLSNPNGLKAQIKSQIVALLNQKNGVKEVKGESKPKRTTSTMVKKSPVIPEVLEETEKIVEGVEKPKRAPRKNKV